MKQHYKMYKDGKKWVFASISTIAVMMAGMSLTGEVHADGNNSNVTVIKSNSSTTSDNNQSESENQQSSTVTSTNNEQNDKNTSTESSMVVPNEDTTPTEVISSSNDSEVASESNKNDVNDESKVDTATSTELSSSASSDISSSAENVVTTEIHNVDTVPTGLESNTTDSKSETDTSSTDEILVTGNQTTSVAIDSSANTAVNPNDSSDSSLENNETAVESSDTDSNQSTSDSDNQSGVEITQAIDSVSETNEANQHEVYDERVQSAKATDNLTKADDDTTATHVTTWQEFTNAVTNAATHEIIVDNDIVGTGSGSINIPSANTGLIIRSNDNGRYKVDFSGHYITGKTDLTYKNIDIYSTSYYGVLNENNAGKSATLTFIDMTYTGAQLFYANANTTAIFQGHNVVNTVNEYTSPDGTTVSVANAQQVMEFTAANSHVIFDTDSQFEGSTYKDNVIKMTGANSSITVKDGAVVTLIPHDNGTFTTGNAEGSSKANGIYMSGSGTLTVESGGTLNINADETSKNAIAAISITDVNTVVNIEDGAKVNINVTGNISKNGSWGQEANTAIYINGKLNIGKNAEFNVLGHDMADFAGTLVHINGNAVLTGSIFKVSLDDATSGTGKIILLDTGKNVEIDNPNDFLLYTGTNTNAQWIKDASFVISKSRLKDDTGITGPFKTISFTGSNGKITVSTTDQDKIIGLTQADEQALISKLNALGTAESAAKLEFVAANDFVSLSDDITITTNSDGSKTITGYTDVAGAYIHADVNGDEIKGNALESPYWRENGVDSTVVYAAQSATVADDSGKGYKFTFTIPTDEVSDLTPGSDINLLATRNFIDSDVASQDLEILTKDQLKEKIEQEKVDAQNQMSQLTNLTDEQRNILNNQLDELAKQAAANIDDATGNTDASQSYDVWHNDITDFNELTSNKDADTSALNQAATAAKDAIDANVNLTDDVKNAYKAQIDESVNAVNVQIANAKDTDSLNQAITNGKETVTAVALEASKANAIIEVETAAKNSKETIANNTSLSDEEKAQYNAEIEKIVTDTTTSINSAVDEDSIDTAKIAGTQKIADTTLQAAKTNAISKIKATSETAKEAIANDANLTADEKAMYVAQIESSVTNATTTINNAIDNDIISQAETNAETAITGTVDVATLQNAKNAAIAALTTARTDAISQIQNASLSDERKTALIDEVTTAYNTAVNNVNNATTTTTVATTGTDGQAAIDAVLDKLTIESVALQDAKDAANSKLDAAAATANATIEADTNLTADEKTSYKAKVTQALATAQDKINAGTDVKTVNQAEANGETTFTSIVGAAALQDAKNAANSKLTIAAATANATIEADANLTADEKTSYKAEVTQALATAQDKINAGTDAETINQAEANGETTFTSIVGSAALQDAKNAANSKLSAAAATASATIEADANLTADEKTTYKSAVAQALAAAQGKINAGTDAETINQAEGNGETALATVVSAAMLQDAKNVANNQLDDAASAANAAIEADTNLTDDEKIAYKTEIAQKLATAQAAVNASTDVDAINQAEANGKTTFTTTVNVAVLQGTKNAAIKALATARTDVIDQIQSSTLSDDRKAALIEEVTDAYTTAENNVTAATTTKAVATAGSEGRTAIYAVLDDLTTESAALQGAKDAANSRLEAAATVADTAIEADANLTADEKTSYKAEVAKALASAQDKVNAGTDAETINQAEASGKTAITTTVSDAKLQDTKNAANSKLATAAATANTMIDADTNLTADEKTSYKAEVAQTLASAQDKVNASMDVDGINQALASGTTSFSETVGVAALQDKKNAANSKLAAAATAANAVIEADANLTTDEKTAYKAEVAKALASAQDKVNAGTDAEMIDQAEANGETTFTSVIGSAALQDAKNAANSKLAAVATATNVAIEADANLTADEKTSYKAEVAQALASAQDKVNAGTDAETINQAEANGETTFTSIVGSAALQDAKNAANSKLAAEASQANKAIEANHNLTSEEKVAYKTEVAQALANAQDKVNAGTDADAINQVIADGTTTFTETVEAAVLQDTKNATMKSLTDARTDVVNQIQKSALSDDRKTALIKEVTDAYHATENNVTAATTTKAVATAGSDGKTAIYAVADKLTAESAALQDAKNAANSKLNEAATTANAAIEADADLTADEKMSYKAEVAQALATAQAAVNAGTEAAAINQAEANGKITFTGIVDAAALQDAKNIVLKELKVARTDVVNQIQKSALSDDRKTALIKEVTDAYNVAENNVTAATTTEAIATAGSDGKTAIYAVADKLTAESTALQDAKNAANSKLNEAATAANAAIDADTNLSDAEKTTYKEEVAQTLTSAQDKVNAGTDADTINQVITDGTTTINTIVDAAGLQDAKNAANSKLNEAATAANAVIDADTNLSDAEKTTYKEEVAQTLTSAQDKVNAGTDADAINQVITDGTTTINTIVDAAALQDAKNAANSRLDDAATVANAAIDADTNLSDAEKTTYKEEVAQTLTSAQDKVNAGTDSDTINQVITDGTTTINTIVGTAALQNAKSATTAALATERTNVVNQIQKSALSDDRKTALIKEVTDAYNAAENNVTAAKTISAVAKAGNAGQTDIDAVLNKLTTESTILQETKDAANSQLDTAATAANAAIEADTNLTADEKTSYKAEVAQALATAQAAVNAGTEVDAVNQDAANGETTFTGIIDAAALQDAKNAANSRLDDAATVANAAIEADANLTVDEKIAYKAEVAQALATAQETVNMGTDINEINQAEANGKTTFTGTIHTAALQDAKNEANNRLDEAATAANAAIEADTNLTVDEKSSYKAKVTQALTTAKDAINTDTDTTTINQTEANGKTTFTGIIGDARLQDTKNAAMKALAVAHTDVVDQIQNSALSDERKSALVAEVTDAYNTAINNVDSATTMAATTIAGTEGQTAIYAILDDLTTESAALQESKNAANDRLDEVADTANAAIEADANLTVTEKAAYKTEVAQALATAKNAINAGTDTATIDQANIIGEITLNNIIDTAALQDAKNAANSRLDEAADTANAAIEADANLTAAEKAAYKTEVAQALATAKDAVNADTDVVTINQAEANGKTALTATINVAALQDAKNAANSRLDEAADIANAAIEADANLTAAEKAAYKTEVVQALATAKDAVNASADAATLNQAEANGKTALTATVNVAALQDAKNAANGRLDEAATAANVAIDADINLTAAEKATYKTKVAQALATAKDAVNASADAATLNQAEANGKTTLTEIISTAALQDTKNATIKSLTDARTDVVNQIQKSALSDDRKTALIKEVTDAYHAAENNVTAATTTKAVATAGSDGKTAIYAVADKLTAESAALQDAKNEANSKLAAVATVANAAIEADANLTADEKTSYKAEVAQALATAQAAVNAGTDVDAINQAIADSTTNINTIVDAAALQNAKNIVLKELKVARTDVVNQIQKSALSDDRKTALIKEVTDAYHAAENNVTAATTTEAIATAGSDGKTAIYVVADKLTSESTVLQDAKNAANSKLNEAAMAANAAIDADTNLSDAEKTTYKAEIAKKLAIAQATINTSTEADTINQAEVNGKVALTTIVDAAALQDTKNAAITELTAAWTNVINQIQNSALSDDRKMALITEVNDAYRTAITNINVATTTTAVMAADVKGRTLIYGVLEMITEEQTTFENNGTTSDGKLSNDNSKKGDIVVNNVNNDNKSHSELNKNLGINNDIKLPETNVKQSESVNTLFVEVFSLLVLLMLGSMGYRRNKKED